MDPRVSIAPRARQDLVQALAWYRLEGGAIADRFERDFDESFRRIADFPAAAARIGAHERGCMMRRFPYRTIYRGIGGLVFVLAVAHTSRELGYWRIDDD